MRSRDTIRLRVFRYFERHVQPDDQPRTIADVAEALVMDRRQAELAIRALAKANSVCVSGGSARSGLFYCFVPGAKPPVDRRGKQKNPKRGAAWAAVRKRQRNLDRAREALRRKRTIAKIEAELPAFARWLG